MGKRTLIDLTESIEDNISDCETLLDEIIGPLPEDEKSAAMNVCLIGTLIGKLINLEYRTTRLNKQLEITRLTIFREDTPCC